MGLDMYLTGERCFSRIDKSEGTLVGERYSLGYWRKHPNLHGYIVNRFAEGRDDCQEITLGTEQMEQILNAVQTDQLPHTEGFFFGSSAGREKDYDIHVFTNAIRWLDESDEAYRFVIYQASW